MRRSQSRPWPEWVPAGLSERLAERGVPSPWRHQVEAAQLAHDGRHVVVATGTASGKSLAYQLPALSRLAEDPRACVLYLAPTKALARDQLASVTELADPSVRPAPYDGDTPQEERDWVRRHSRWIVTNPDMLHRGILPAHQRWSSTLRRLAYVVIDECHAYRGVSPSNVAGRTPSSPSRTMARHWSAARALGGARYRTVARGSVSSRASPGSW